MKRYLKTLAIFVVLIFGLIILLSNLGLSYVHIPAIRSLNDMSCFLKMIGEDTKIPFISEQLRAIKVNKTITDEYSSFDSEYYPYYAALSNEEKELYTVMYAHADNKNKSFYSNSFEFSGDVVQKVWDSMYYDHPELYWLSTSFEYVCGLDGNVNGVFLKFNGLEEENAVSGEIFRKATLEFLSDCSEITDPYQKEMHIHNKLLSTTRYSFDSEVNQSAYSAIVNQETVCAGYVKALQYLLIQEGIPCYYVSGESEGVNHAWAIVKLDDGYYYVDPTWNDSMKTYAFFNRTDSEFSNTYTRCELSQVLPLCEGGIHKNNEVLPKVIVD